MNYLIVCLILIQVTYIRCESKCNELTTCGQCIGYSQERCVWCAQNEVNLTRCQSESYQERFGKTWCDPQYVQNPGHEVNIIQDMEWRAEYPAVQFRPQNIKIKARPGFSVNITVAYSPAMHYPLDVYYLIDNSYTMLPQKSSLKAQIYEIQLKLANLTNNVRVGFGSFVDKPGFPYAYPGENTYSFKNHVSLTEDIEKVQKALYEMKSGANRDDPEAGLDALMQAMVCQSELGWRKDSSKIIIMFTDGTYHSAGDGKMLGIMTPNDMKCHLDTDKYYSKALELDYPSVGQINKVAYDGSYKIIFAVHRNVKPAYEHLAKHITGSNCTELGNNSNISAIILESYLDSVQVKKINFDAPPNIEVNIDQDCITKPKRNCESTYDRPIMYVPVTIMVKSCPIPTEEDGFHQNVTLRPSNLAEELTIDVDVICECDCEKEQGIVPEYVRQCNFTGYLQCGVCKCNTTRFGDDCNCDSEAETNNCKAHVYDPKVCYGRGDCRCGKCVNCVASTGDYCQFDAIINETNRTYPPGNSISTNLFIEHLILINV